MKTLDQINTEAETGNLEKIITTQEIMLICLACGTQKTTGNYTTKIDYDNKYAYSHGYCSLKCAKKQYPELVSMFSEYDLEKW